MMNNNWSKERTESVVDLWLATRETCDWLCLEEPGRLFIQRKKNVLEALVVSFRK